MFFFTLYIVAKAIYQPKTDSDIFRICFVVRPADKMRSRTPVIEMVELVHVTASLCTVKQQERKKKPYSKLCTSVSLTKMKFYL